MTGIARWAGAMALALLMTGCGSVNQPGSPAESQPAAATASPAASGTPSAGSSRGQGAAPPRDVTNEDLKTAISPEGCSPSTRMVDGRVPGGPPIANVIWAPGAPDSPLFVDLAGLGYKQGLAFFACGGANPLPYFVMLTGRDGALLGEAWLGDLGEYAKSYIIATSVDGSGVTVEWWGAQTAGSTPTHNLTRIGYVGGRLVLSELAPASVLGVPLNQVIRVQEDASFASPSGKLQCRLGHDAAYCEGVSLAAAPDRSYCHAPTGAVSGVRIDGKAGWNCTGQATIFPTTDQAWWQGRGFPTVDSRLAGADAAVLPYGWVLQSNVHACVIWPEGVTCQQLYSGNGFFGNDSEVSFTGAVHQIAGD